MDDQLDDNLKKRIREVFDNFEDTSADEGWLRLREKYPEKQKRRVAAWVWRVPAAALLLLFIGLLWFKNKPADHQQIAAVKNQQAKRSGEHTDGALATGSMERNTNARSNKNTLANNGAPSAAIGLPSVKMANTKKPGQMDNHANVT
ncbi:MAG: hypothetical protein JST32_19400, partial [Bacteroidetes bacterium]|nr:hypothetical protein [Bacteroidota bacterium]